MREFWNQRYENSEFAFGKAPNQFFKQELLELGKGKLLLPAEGEGRNAVFAALNGWDVDAFDYSEEGKKKALQLALEHNVSITYSIASYEQFDVKPNTYDCIGLIYAHVMDGRRSEYHKKLISYLKPGGTVILEAFSKEQINNNTGGPPKVEFLFSKEELENDFNLLKSLKVSTHKTILAEGKYHSGEADIIRLVGKKYQGSNG